MNSIMLNNKVNKIKLEYNFDLHYFITSNNIKEE